MIPFDSTELSKARERILSGDVVAMPTETVYGLAGSIESESGLRKIFSLKERPFFDPLIVHVSSFKQASSLVKEWTPLADFLARTFWPGPLTIVLPKAEHVNPLITSGLETVAIRYPSHPLALELLRLTGVPLAAPSANKFGRTSPTTAEHVRSEFPGTDLIVLDGGACEVGLESTVISFAGEGEKGAEIVLILRPGGVTEDALREALTKWWRPTKVRRATKASEASPGNLEHHYMPKIPLVIVRETEEQDLSADTRKRIETELSLASGIARPVELALGEDPLMAARQLYSEMRRLAETGADLIFVRAAALHGAAGEEKGIWDAVWDRLTRAASLNLDSH